VAETKGGAAVKTGWVLAVAAWLSRNAPTFLQPPEFPTAKLPMLLRTAIGRHPEVLKLIDAVWWEAGARFGLVALAAGLIVGVPIGVGLNVFHRHYRRATESGGEG